MQLNQLDWKYKTVPQTKSCFGLKDKMSNWPRGKLLGGSSAINYMIYIRGNRLDYDNWAFNMNCSGWSYKKVFPYFLKSEDNRDPNYAYNGYHSTGGPLTVETLTSPTPVTNAWNESAHELGYRVGDLNGLFQTGFMIAQGTVRRGARCSAAKAFLRPARKRKNLDVVTFAHVTKIIIKEKRAVGVKFKRFQKWAKVYAKREVIISAGSINSPKLLMLSGIGPRAHLEELGIKVIVLSWSRNQSSRSHLSKPHPVYREKCNFEPKKGSKSHFID